MAGCDAIRHSLLEVDAAMAGRPWREGGWTRRQVLGHMIDSAANNHQRFVRSSLDGSYTGPVYAQEGWVNAHGYDNMPWTVLLEWWQAYHEILKAVVARISEDRLSTMCCVGDNEAVTLRFLIEDYVEHQRHHLRQILA